MPKEISLREHMQRIRSIKSDKRSKAMAENGRKSWKKGLATRRRRAREKKKLTG